MKRIIVVFLLFPLIFSSPVINAQFSGYRLNGDVKKVEVPFENSNNLVIVPVIINNSLPLKFILDTGVPNSIIIDRVISDFLNLGYDRKIDLSGAGSDTAIKAFIVNNVSVSIPGITGNGLNFVVLEEDYLQLDKYFGINVHGIIGADIFNRFIVKVDYEKKILTFYEPSSFKPARPYFALPIRVIDSKPYISAEVSLSDTAGTEVSMMVDLGASHSVLLELDSVNKIQLPEKYLSSSLGRGLGGELSGYVGRINSLTIGKFSFRNLIASFTGNYRSQKDVNENDRNGTIGGEILGRFNVIFDYFNRKLYLRKNINYRRSFEFDMSGIEVIAQNYFPVIFEITDVRINSPAELAGILPGDIITRINGKNPEELTLEQVHEILCSGGNRKIRLDIIRNGNIIKTKFRLKKLI